MTRIDYGKNLILNLSKFEYEKSKKHFNFKLSGFLVNILEMILSIWGFIFRTIFILGLGYFLLDTLKTPSISDIPISQLTMKNIFGSFLAIFFIILCSIWYIHLPEKKSSYVRLGLFGLGLSFLLLKILD